MKRRMLNTINQLVPKGKFVKSVSMLVGGTALGQIIIVLASPVLTRIYNPDEFGVFSLYASILGILAVIATLRYHLAIPLPKRKKEAVNLLVLSIITVVFIGVISLVIILLLNCISPHLTMRNEVGYYILILPLGIVGAGVYETFNYWAIRINAFKKISQTKINQGIGTVITQIGVGFLFAGPIGLIVGQIIGHTAGSTTLMRMFFKKERRALKLVNKSNLLNVLKRYRKFPLISTWTAIFNKLGSQLPVIMLAIYFGPAITGLYALTLRVLQTPMNLIGTSISQVFYSNAVKAKANNNLKELTQKIFISLLQVGMPTLFLMSLIGEKLFLLIFGPNWMEAGLYVKLLVPWLLLVFVSSPLSIIPSLMERQGYEFLFQICIFASRVIALIIGGTTGEPVKTVLLFSLVSAINWFVFILWNMGLVGIRQITVFKLFFNEILITLLIIMPVIIVNIFISQLVFLVIATIISSVFILYRLSKVIKNVNSAF